MSLFGGRSPSLRIELVTTLEQLMATFAVRAIWLMEEEERLPFKQAYDGNDFQCTHALAYDGEEPVGSIRIRWFNDFAKLERLAFRKSHRGIPAVRCLTDFVFRHIARKGYSHVIVHASPKYARLWRLYFGLQRVPGKAKAAYGGVLYEELVKILDVPQDAIRPSTPASVLYRVEGEWDRPARFEMAS